MDFNEAISRFPEFVTDFLKTTPQNPKWHPEGCVMNHVELVFELAKQLDPENVDLQIAALFHDMGKPMTTKINPETGKIRSPGHEALAKEYIEQYSHLFPEAQDWEKIAFICKHHMKMHLFREMREFKRKDLIKHRYFHDLLKFAFCDDNGRGKGAK